ncbi:MAG: BamA/TamA family outer membrane protein, partial [Bacteroidetes bacterium]|nr:BamA/TamA family outer membrane protein [Bacteroidota bacterium]
MNTSIPQFSPILLLFTIFFATHVTSLHAQEGDAREDSLRAVSEVHAEQQVLRQELEELRAEFEMVRREAEGTERDQQLEEIERRIIDVETRLTALERSLEPGSFDDWDDEWDEWDDETSYGSDTDDWFAGADDQFAVDEMFFRKFPSNFPWSFPLTTRLHETLFRYNRVEGLYLGIAQSKRIYWNSKPWLVSTGSLGYGFANHTWRYSLGLYLPFYLEDQIIEIGAEGHSFTDSKDQWAFDRDENTLIALIAREDFLDYFERRGFTATASWYFRGKDDLNLRATVGYAHDTYASMTRSTNWSIFGGDKDFRDNPGINNGNVNSIILSAGMNTLASLDVRKNGWDATLQFEKAGDVFAGDFAFSQLLLDLRRYQPINTHLNLNLRLRGGISDGVLPLQRAFELGGPSTLPAYRYKEFTG